MTELYGRRKVLRFVADGLDRSQGRDTPPIVLLIGQRGSGKTALLDQLEDAYRGGMSTARLDFGKAPDASPAPIMLGIISQLSNRVPRIGRVRFPRLSIGLIAVSLDPEDLSGPAEQLSRRLSDRRQVTGQALAGFASEAAALLPDPEGRVIKDLGAVIGWIVDGIRKRQLDGYLDWYGTATNRGDGTRFGPLLYLYQQWRKATERQEEDTSVSHDDTDAEFRRDEARRDAAGQVWRALCRALLADLREEFDKPGLTHGLRTANCLLLLDDADADASREFIETLAECREENPRETDPLLVIAAKRMLPGRRPRIGTPILATDDHLDYATWLDGARKQEEERSQWYPVMLTELSASNVESMIRSHVLARKWQDADHVYALTGGHPAASRVLARRLAAAGQGFDIRDLISPEVEGELLGVLRPPDTTPGDRELDAMAVLSVAYCPTSNAGSGAFAHLGWANIRESDIRELFISLMWGHEEEGNEGLVVDPLPRFLLSRRLSADRSRWESAHNGFLTHYRTPNGRDEIAENYHLLALSFSRSYSHIPQVAGFLDRRLADHEPDEWNKDLAVITSAPNRIRIADHDRHRDTGLELEFAGGPEAAVRQLADVEDRNDRERIIARLVTARWLYNDRLFDPSRRLAQMLGDEYYALAGMTPGKNEVFFREARHFWRIAREWEDRP